MPFSRYLQSNERDSSPHPDDDIDHHPAFASQVHFQLPNLFNAPTVPPGGGAEALPAGLYPPSSSLAWFSNADALNSAFPLHPAYHPSSSSPSSSSPPHSANSAFSIAPLSPPYSNLPSSQPIIQPPIPPHLSLPSALGLPIYSASGFDLLSLLARVATRPYPKIYLGPVDLSCSFVVTDARRYDSPIVYASPSFLKLTGYDEREVLGRNCRFLQAPDGLLQPGQERAHTSSDAVAYMRKNIVADKECQVTIINYRKDRSAFINMVSVIPLRGGVNNSPEEADDVVYHIGFQVDLTEQPKSILSKLKDGTYVVNYSDKSVPLPSANRDWRTSSLTMRGTSKDLRNLLSDPAFTASFHLSASTHASTAIALSTNPAEPLTLDPYDGNKPLHMFLLDRSPDFLHVVSLKGAFLYVAPAVRLVLGYDPDELVGRSLSEFCHPADCVPLMRELKEASTTPGPSVLASNTPSSSLAPMTNSAHPELPSSTPSISPRPVDLLFRMQAKGRGYVWIECRGRLHVEPGKGRKAIILSGRLRTMPHLQWGPISRAGGLVAPLPKPLLPSPSSSGSMSASHDTDEDADGERHVEREFWGLLSAHATFLYAGTAVRDVLGWGAGEVIGKPLADFVSGNSAQEVQAAIEVEITKVLADAGGSESSGLACIVQTKQGGTMSAHIVLYNSRGPPPQSNVIHPLTNAADPAAQAPIACQVKLCDKNSSPPPTNAVVHSLTDSVFEETDIDRTSSWQYELQQLKFKNQRLAEEVAALDASIMKKLRRKQQQQHPPTGHAAVAGPGGAPVGQRMNITYAPHSHTPAMNVRFVPGSQGLPRGAAHALPSASQSTLASQVVHHSSHPPPPPPPPPPQVQHRPHPVQQIPLPPPPVSIPQGYEQRVQQQSQQQLDEPIYTSLRIRHSTESSLQGWSAYDYAQAGQGSANGSSQNHSGSFNGLPVKRTWNDPLRDPGGGGGA
ncbi:PAS domain-containing protein [Fomes fomentarius]|nr:PAS domain-containing protein [Fomes fomentarius]